jgi:hypothetical protein
MSSFDEGVEVGLAASEASAPTAAASDLANASANGREPAAEENTLDQPPVEEVTANAVAESGVDEADPTETSWAKPAGTSVVRVNQPGEALPVLARATATAWLRAAAWGVGTSLRVGAQIARAATDPHAATELYSDFTEGLRNYAREFLGITDLERDVNLLAPRSGSSRDPQMSQATLRAQGAELLRAAADVGFDESAHPAYARILSELAPDEARILRLLATAGPQPLVDVRQGNLIGLGSQLIAPSMNMLGAQAGLRHRDRVQIYLSNLSRLGLIEISDTPVADPLAYQVLEAQPDVLGMIKQTARAKTQQRRLALTPLGGDFCEVCLPLRLPELPAGD